MFFNTTNEKGKNLNTAVGSAYSQTEFIKALYKAYLFASPSQLLIHFENTPLTSIRRSINTLTKEGYLIKTEQKTNGIYGRPEHIWVLKKHYHKQGELISPEGLTGVYEFFQYYENANIQVLSNYGNLITIKLK